MLPYSGAPPAKYIVCDGDVSIIASNTHTLYLIGYIPYNLWVQDEGCILIAASNQLVFHPYFAVNG